MAPIYPILGILLLLVFYLWHVNRGMSGSPPDALGFSPKRWTEDEIRSAYKDTQNSPTNVSQHLPPKQRRRYIVVGGSGLVGGWIIQHLLIRGEDPEAIRLLDLREPTQSAIVHSKVQFIKTDVSSVESVDQAFNAPWSSSHISNLPITVFHTVAYINPSERKEDFMAIYQAVNINGTRHVLAAAKNVGATCLIATASGSIGVNPPSYFMSPLSRWPSQIFQILNKPKKFDTTRPISAYCSCYAYSKALAEWYVVNADSPNLRTGCVRPGHAIYGAGVRGISSISWQYLSRGGSPSWLHEVVTNLVNAQNVSIAHLAYEASLLSGKGIGGRTYYVTDPGPPIFFGSLYSLLTTLAHKDTPARFPRIPPVPILLMAYVIEAYMLLRARFLSSLPPITGDISVITPAMFNMSSVHIVYDNSLAREEIDYKPPISTMEGLCLQLLEWNGEVEQRIGEKGGLSPWQVRDGSLEVGVNVPVVGAVNKMI